MILVAALGMFLAVWLAPAAVDVRDRLQPAVGSSGYVTRLILRWPYGVALAAGALAAWLAGFLPGVAAGMVGCTAAWLVGTYRGRRAAGQRQAAVAEACRALAALLRVGHVPSAALREVAEDAPVMTDVVAAQRIGGDVAPVLRRLATTPGNRGLAELANAWEISERTGASLTATLDAVAERLVAQNQVRQIVNAELSAPRSTGRLLAALPAAGLVLGFFMGGDPVAFLGGSVVGQVVLVAGVALACIGIVWTERIADAGGQP